MVVSLVQITLNSPYSNLNCRPLSFSDALEMLIVHNFDLNFISKLIACFRFDGKVQHGGIFESKFVSKTKILLLLRFKG